MAIARAGARGRLFSLDDVIDARQPATFSAFGDHLLFVDGIVYSLPRDPMPSEFAEPLDVPGSYIVTQTVGIEYGWRHVAGCDCSLCAPEMRQAA